MNSTDLYSIRTKINGTEYSLYDLAIWRNGLAFKNIDFSKTGKPVIKIAELNNGITSNTAYTNKKYDEDRYVTKGDFLFSWSGNPDTSIDIFRYNLCDGWLNQHIFKVLPKENIVDRNYFFYLMKFLMPRFIEIARNKQTTGLGHVTVADLKKIRVVVPNMDIQKEIAKILYCFDKKIEINSKKISNLMAQSAYVFDDWFVSFKHFNNSIPNDWKQGVLSEIVSFGNGYAFASDDFIDSPTVDSFAVFKQGHIKRGGGLNINGTKSWFPKERFNDRLNKYVLHKGDVLMAMTDMKGNVAILGNTAFVWEDNHYILNQRVGLLRPIQGKGVTYPFIYLLTNSNSFLLDLRGRANSGVQVNLSSTEIKNSKIMIAPKEQYEEFANIVDPIFEMVTILEKQNQTLGKIRDFAIQKVLSGNLDVESFVMKEE